MRASGKNIFNSSKKYQYIYDGGTIEHIFNIPQVIENIIDILDINGLFVSITCNNNFSGHGIYQFSPEFFLAVFSEITRSPTGGASSLNKVVGKSLPLLVKIVYALTICSKFTETP